MRAGDVYSSFVFPLLLLALARSSASSNVTRATREAVDGTHKYLIFPQGSNVQLVYCLTLATYTKPQGFFTFGVTAGLAYELPYRRSVPYRKPAEVYHRRSRRDLYRRIERMLETQGKNGRDCVLKALCQAGRRNRNATTTSVKAAFLQELLHSIFTFPAHEEDDDDVDEGEEQTAETQRLRSNVAEYDRAYSAELDCDSLFDTCPTIF